MRYFCKIAETKGLGVDVHCSKLHEKLLAMNGTNIYLAAVIGKSMQMRTLQSHLCANVRIIYISDMGFQLMSYGVHLL